MDDGGVGGVTLKRMAISGRNGPSKETDITHVPDIYRYHVKILSDYFP